MLLVSLVSLVSLVIGCRRQAPASIAVLPTLVNPTTLTAALAVGEEPVVLGEGTTGQLNQV